MGNPMITVQNLSFGYGKDLILSDVNFTVEENEYVGIIGANGAGKSTLMKLILGQLSPTQGNISVNAKVIGYVPQVGFQAVSNFPANVEEIVMTGLHSTIGMFRFPKKEHRKKVKEALALVGMEKERKKMLSELSGGQQQRVMIARALVMSPQLLVLDEPLTGIDKEAGEQLYLLLDKLNKEHGMTIVMVTHNREQVGRFTNKFYHVNHGSVHLDQSSILCDEMVMDHVIMPKPNRYRGRNKKEQHRLPDSEQLEDADRKKEPYDASYKGRRSTKKEGR